VVLSLSHAKSTMRNMRQAARKALDLYRQLRHRAGEAQTSLGAGGGS